MILPSFDAPLTLMDSAQAFHWSQDAEGGYRAVVAGRAVRLCKVEGGFFLQDARAQDIPFWCDYFDLKRDYAALARSLCAYPKAQEAMERLPGLRVLHQPAWEALLAFILSANNNVGRIRGIVKRLQALSEDGGFPTPLALSKMSEETLRNIGCGYRAPYLIKTARFICEGFPLETLRKLPYEEAHQELLRLPGVGDKVADCVLLFGLGHSEAFPVDVWVERLMKSWFLPDARSRREIALRAREMFGTQAGIVQQYLFHCARLHLIAL